MTVPPAPEPADDGAAAPAARRRSWRLGRLPAICLVIAAAFGGGTAWDLLGSRQRNWQAAAESARYLSLLVSLEIGQSVEQLDQALRLAAARLATAPTPPVPRRAFLFGGAAAQADLRLVFLVDAGGSVTLASRADAALPPGQAEMEYVRVHRDRSWGGLFISRPFAGPDGQEVLAFSRRLADADDGFAGVVVALLDTGAIRRRFAAHLRSVESGFALGLYRGDGVRLAGAAAPGAAQPPGENMDEIIRQAAWRPDDVLTLHAPAEGPLLGAFAQVVGRPLLVSVTRDAADIDAGWRLHAIIRGLMTVGLLIALLAPILLLQREVVRRRAAELAARRNSDEFRLLTENSGDMVSRIGPDRRRRYISSACRRILGYAPSELIGNAPSSATHPDDRQPMLDAVAPVYAGEVETATTAYRIRHRDGRWIWLEATVRSVRDPVTGLPDGIVAIARDITERKRLEAELAKVATEDPLTGLANRRAFDAGFGREWHRCAGLRLPMAVLLIDVDQFKLFNDRYGHPEGDACLRRVAAVIGGAAAHPVDLAARYGGEEFILLLPGSPLPEAMRRAETIRAAVEALAIPHAAAGAGRRVVTVSIGLAAAIPDVDAGETVAEALVQRADRGLYEAKHQGRNRVVAARSLDAVTEPAIQAG
ncbi:MAG TPA: diguanylate cyclase [Roseomonas sp.]|jgi:diguanylate cyclase (GGDEF)-like protein/PAS domain S-box-containing protein